MKRTLLAFGALLIGFAFTPIVADPAPAYDPAPLPPGPILARVPAYAEWRINYTYAPPPDSGQGNSSSSSNANGQAYRPSPSLPQTFTMTQTKPIWHAVMINGAGEKKESWYDGMMRYEQASGSSGFFPVLSNPGNNTSIYFSDGKDFPDVGWVSSGNYLGLQKGTSYWVFRQSPEGPMLWVDSITHYPVRWMAGRETRTYQFPPAPTEPLTLPPGIAAYSKAFKRLDAQARSTPPGI